jgi:hypothetical protein
MAREERVDGNLGDPEESRRANYGSQAGRKVQRQEELSKASPGVRSAHSSPPLAGQGADNITQSHRNPVPRDRRIKSGSNLPCAGASDDEEPGEGKPPAGICAGGAGQPASLPRSLLHDQSLLNLDKLSCSDKLPA